MRSFRETETGGLDYNQSRVGVMDGLTWLTVDPEPLTRIPGKVSFRIAIKISEKDRKLHRYLPILKKSH